MLRFRGDPLGVVSDLVEGWGDYVSFPVAGIYLVLINHPDGVSHVLSRSGDRYKKSDTYRHLKLLVGEGLLTSEGDLWRRQRRIVQPLFRKRELGRFTPLITHSTAEMLGEWRRRPPNQPIDLSVEMTRLTLHVVGRALLGADLGDDVDVIGEQMGVALPFLLNRLSGLFNVPLWMPMPSHLRFRRAIRELDRIVDGLIAERSAGGAAADSKDLLTMLVNARDPETGEAMGARQLRDEVVTFLVAGHETTANALVWILYQIANHPQVEERLLAEAREVLGERTPTAEDLPNMPYTRGVILEGMRLYPPVWVVEREALADDVVMGHRIPQGSWLLLPTYTVHRHPKFWDDPERFDPERFLPERSAGRHKAAYFPFGAGQRKCIGEAFAMFEMQLAVPMLLRAFHLELVPNHPVVPVPRITLYPRHGLLVTRQER